MSAPLLLLTAASLAGAPAAPDAATLALPSLALTIRADDVGMERAVDVEIDAIPTAPAPYGTRGTTRLRFQLMGGVDIDRNSNTMIVGGIALENFVAEGLSVDLELNGLHFDQDGDDPTAINFGLNFRWHLIRDEDSSVFLDIGAGLLWSSDDVPDHGSSFNFTPQAGGGFTTDLGNDVRLLAGVKIYHISNANSHPTNPGRDQIVGHVGISIPF